MILFTFMLTVEYFWKHNNKTSLCLDSDAHSTTSSLSPSQSPSYSNQSDDCSDIESKQRRSAPSAFSFLDRSYWKRYVSGSHQHCVMWETGGEMLNKPQLISMHVTEILVFVPCRQKVCCGIVYKGRFGEVIIDPRLFKPCCSSKKQETLVPTQIDSHLPSTLPSPLPEEMKEAW